MITQEQLKELLDYDPDTGVFILKKATSIRNRCKVGEQVGCVQKMGESKYLTLRINYKLYLLHRLAWLYVYGHFPESEIEHINSDGTDNRMCNLQEASHSTNHKNIFMPKNNTSGIIGVHWDKAKRKWVASIKSDGVRMSLGVFQNLFDAACARKTSEIKYGFNSSHGSLRI